MAGHWRDVSSSSLLLIGLLGVIALGFGLLGGTVLLPLGGVAIWVVLGLLAFVGIQLLLFRLLGLRSAADERPGDEPPPDAADVDDTQDADDEASRADWRAWRG